MKNKKTKFSNLYLLLYLLLLVVLLIGGTRSTYAQTETPEVPATPTAVETAESPTEVESGLPGSGSVNLTFAQLGEEPIDMLSPAISKLSFSLPYRWVIDQGNSYLELNFDVSQSYPLSQSNGSVEGSLANNTTFSIFLDGVLLTSFAPSSGVNQTLRLPIPFDTFTNPDKIRHEIRFVLQGNECLSTAQTRVVIRNDSNIQLAYDIQPPTINLADFPRPLVQGGFLPESLLIVVPDAFNEADLAAAASVAAAIGQEVGDSVTLSIAPASTITNTQLISQSVIAIGSPDRNAFIADLYQRDLLPTTVNAEGVIMSDNQPVPQDYAVLQEIQSEMSTEQVYLILTGGSDLAITRAAQALSTNAPIFGLRNNLALLEDVQETELDIVATDAPIISLADTGFYDTTWRGATQDSRSVYFFIPSNWALQEGASLTLAYVPAAALDANASNLRIDLNDKLIGDVPLDNPELGEQQITIPLPEYRLDAGKYNSIRFTANLASDDPCPSVESPTIWLRLSDQSYISLPHELVLDEDLVASPTQPFSVNDRMSDLLFVLPESPSDTDLYSLVQLAQMMGSRRVGSGFRPQVQFAPIVDQASLELYQVIALGRPSTNALIADVNEQLPQPFLPGSDTLGESVGDLNYRLPQGFSLGVIQSIRAPWNDAQPFVVVTGTTDEGVRWASEALSNGGLSNELEGNLVFVQDEFVEIFDLLAARQAEELGAMSAIIPDTLPVSTGVPAETAVSPATTEATPTPNTSAPLLPIDNKYQPPETMTSRISIIIYALIIIGLLILVVGAIWTWRKSKKTADNQ